MFQEIWKMQKERKYILQGAIAFALFITIYTVLDYLNGGYLSFYEEYGLALVIGNIALNLVMTVISVFLLNMSSAMVAFNNGKEGKSSILTNFAIIFGMLTYGCTPCVVAFFSIFGVVLSVAVLPLAGLPYKLISLAILIIGLFWLRHEINHPKCNIKKKETIDHKETV